MLDSSEPLSETERPPGSGEFAFDLVKARQGSSHALGGLLETCRDYLLLVANSEVPGDIRPKVAASDLVQQSLAEAWQAFGDFEGQNQFQLRGWLRQILLNNLRDTIRGFRDTAKRGAATEIPLAGENSGCS